MAFLATLLRRPPNERAYLLVPVGYPAPDAEVRRSAGERSRTCSPSTSRDDLECGSVERGAASLDRFRAAAISPSAKRGRASSGPVPPCFASSWARSAHSCARVTSPLRSCTKQRPRSARTASTRASQRSASRSANRNARCASPCSPSRKRVSPRKLLSAAVSFPDRRAPSPVAGPRRARPAPRHGLPVRGKIRARTKCTWGLPPSVADLSLSSVCVVEQVSRSLDVPGDGVGIAQVEEGDGLLP